MIVNYVPVMHIAKPSARRAGEVQCLGEMPWISRATAIKPDICKYNLARPKVNKIANVSIADNKGIGMKTIMIVSVVVVGYISMLGPARAADSCKECRDFQRACLAAHSMAACKTDYDICKKHCRQSILVQPCRGSVSEA